MISIGHNIEHYYYKFAERAETTETAETALVARVLMSPAATNAFEVAKGPLCMTLLATRCSG